MLVGNGIGFMTFDKLNIPGGRFKFNLRRAVTKLEVCLNGTIN